MRRRIPAVFMRGGTSKGVFFHERDLPPGDEERTDLFLRVLGSPDPYGRQLDGLGGGISSLSKIAVIGPSSRPDADVDYTFGQVAVGERVVDYGGNCGNLSSAVGPFAVEEGLVQAADGETLVRVYNTNTQGMIHARFAVEGGLPLESGELELPGVPGRGAPIVLDFIDPAGSLTAGVLPTGAERELLDVRGRGEVEVSLVDATNPMVFAAAERFGLDGTEHPDELERDPVLMHDLEALRREAAGRMGMTAGLLNPRVALIAPPRPFSALDERSYGADQLDVSVRMLSMQRVHRAVTVTGAMCLAAACQIDGTIPRDLVAGSTGQLRVGHPSGVLEVDADVVHGHAGWDVRTTRLVRTARRLMDGHVVVPN